MTQATNQTNSIQQTNHSIIGFTENHNFSTFRQYVDSIDNAEQFIPFMHELQDALENADRRLTFIRCYSIGYAYLRGKDFGKVYINDPITRKPRLDKFEGDYLSHEQIGAIFGISVRTSEQYSCVVQNIEPYLELDSTLLDRLEKNISFSTLRTILDFDSTKFEPGNTVMSYINRAMDEGWSKAVTVSNIKAENPKLLGKNKKLSEIEKKDRIIEDLKSDKYMLQEDIKFLQGRMRDAQARVDAIELPEEQRQKAIRLGKSLADDKYEEERERTQRQLENQSKQIKSLTEQLESLTQKMTNEMSQKKTLESNLKSILDNQNKDIQEEVNRLFSERSAKLQSDLEERQKEVKSLKETVEKSKITTGKALIELLKSLPKNVLNEAFKWMKSQNLSD